MTMDTWTKVAAAVAAWCFWPVVIALVVVASKATADCIREWIDQHSPAIREDRQVARLEEWFDYDEIAAETVPDDLERLWMLPARRPVA